MCYEARLPEATSGADFLGQYSSHWDAATQIDPAQVRVHVWVGGCVRGWAGGWVGCRQVCFVTPPVARCNALLPSRCSLHDCPDLLFLPLLALPSRPMPCAHLLATPCMRTSGCTPSDRCRCWPCCWPCCRRRRCCCSWCRRCSCCCDRCTRAWLAVRRAQVSRPALILVCSLCAELTKGPPRRCAACCRCWRRHRADQSSWRCWGS